MGLSKILPSTSTTIAAICIGIGVILFHPTLPPDLEFEAYDLKIGSLEGPLKLNGALDNAERLFEGQIKGPEHLVVHKGELYTSLHGGHIVKVTENSIEPVVKFGKDCEGYWEEKKCGRPLGFVTDENQTFYIADAYYGVKTFNLKTGSVTPLVDVDTRIDGKLPMVPNSVAVARDGKVYWTDSSNTHHLQDLLFSFLGGPTGRLIVYDPATDTNTVLMDNLQFANGVVLSPDESFVIVAETGLARLRRYYLKGEKAGTSDIFIDKLPGLPDNIHHDGKGTYWVCIVDPVNNLFKFAPRFPLLRKFIARSLMLIQSGVKELNRLSPHRSLVYAHHIIGHFEMLRPLKIFESQRATIVYFNKDGKITKSLHSTDGKISGISSMVIHNGYYYLGSPTNDYLARVKI